MGCRPHRDGNPNERDHTRRDHGSRLCRRHALRAVLLRPAGGDDHLVAHARAVFLSSQSLYGLRVPRTSLRRAYQDARELTVPHVTGAAGWCNYRGAGGDPVDCTRVQPHLNDCCNRVADDALYDVRGCASGHLDRRETDGRYCGGTGSGGVRTRFGTTRRCWPRRGPPHCGCDGSTYYNRLSVRPERDLHVLVRVDRRAFLDARLLRM